MSENDLCVYVYINFIVKPIKSAVLRRLCPTYSCSHFDAS